MGNMIFVINCGSSSVKFQLMDPSSEEVYLKGLAENIGSDRCIIKYEGNKNLLPGMNYKGILREILTLLSPFQKDLIGIGHRVVHGGEYFSESALVTEDVLDKIKSCIPLAPLHNSANALGIEVCIEKFPKLPNVAVFDTAFHATLPKQAYLYAIPYEYYTKYHVRRYGFHGTSHRFVAAAAKDLLSKSSKLIIAHLGNGASVCAVKDGKSVDTSMGFTPLEGLIMGTRAGDIDTAVLPLLAEKTGKSLSELLEMLNKESGLHGISGISGDMRLLEEKAEDGNPRACLAIEMFCYRLAKYIASYQVPLGRCDALIFTGGIGENSSTIREKVVGYLPYFSIDQPAHAALKRGSSGIISTKDSPLIAVIPTNEELLIAKDTDRIRRAL
jgi:acetate kinase